MTFSEKKKICMQYFDAQAEKMDQRCNRDKNGNILSPKQEKITQKTHDFQYGANLFMLDELPDPEDNRKYRELFAKYFNLATLPFYWLFHEKWHTDFLQNAESGEVNFRGYYGEHEAKIDGKIYPFTLHKGETEQTIIL